MFTPKCADFQTQLDDAIERRSALDPLGQTIGSAGEASEHLSECADCRAKLREAIQLSDLLETWGGQRWDEVSFADAVLEEWLESSTVAAGPPLRSTALPEPSTAGFSQGLRDGTTIVSPAPTVTEPMAGRFSHLAALAVVAGSLLTLFLMISRDPRGSRGNSVANVGVSKGAAIAKRAEPSGSGSPGTNDAAPGSTVEIAGVLREAGSAYLSLAGEAAGVVREVATLVTPNRDRRMATPAPLPEEAAAPKSPWEQRLDAAMDFFLDSGPGAETPSSI